MPSTNGWWEMNPLLQDAEPWLTRFRIRGSICYDGDGRVFHMPTIDGFLHLVNGRIYLDDNDVLNRASRSLGRDITFTRIIHVDELDYDSEEEQDQTAGDKPPNEQAVQTSLVWTFRCACDHFVDERRTRPLNGMWQIWQVQYGKARKWMRRFRIEGSQLVDNQGHIHGLTLVDQANAAFLGAGKLTMRKGILYYRIPHCLALSYRRISFDSDARLLETKDGDNPRDAQSLAEYDHAGSESHEESREGHCFQISHQTTPTLDIAGVS